MFWKILLSLVSAALIIFLVWWARGAMLTPISLGKQSKLTITLIVHGYEPALEETLDGLVWLRDNGTLRGEIVLIDDGMDEETRQIAMLSERRYPCIRLQSSKDAEECQNQKDTSK